MRMTKTNRYLLVLTALLLVACHSGKENEDVQQNMEMHQQEDVEAYVDTMVLHQTQFNKQIVCNGKLAAKAKSELNFNIQGVIDDVMVKEGQRVDKGTLIAIVVCGKFLIECFLKLFHPFEFLLQSFPSINDIYRQTIDFFYVDMVHL